MRTLFHPVLGLIVVAAHVREFEWGRMSNRGGMGFVDARAQHPNRVPVVLYNVNIPINDSYNRVDGAAYGHDIARWITETIARETLGFD